MEMSKKSKMLAAILAISFVAYNVILFVAEGFANHTGVFWISWVFMLVAFAAMATVGVVFGKSGMSLRDWLFGYPLIKHATIYIIAELLLSTLFIILETVISPQLAFILQFVLLCVFAVFAISCFLAKETITDVKTKVSDKTRYIRMLQADAEMLVEKCTDPEIKEMCRQLAEDIRYSDPMSDEALFELEKDINLAVSECNNSLLANDLENAKHFCKKAQLLLVERNKKCKVLK